MTGFRVLTPGSLLLSLPEPPGEVNLGLVRLQAEGDEGPLGVEEVQGGGVAADGVLEES